MWCQGTYLYKCIFSPILTGSGQHPGPASGATWPCWMKLKWPSAASRPDLCLLEEKQERSISIFSSSGLAKFQASLEEGRGPEKLLVMLKSCRRVGRKEFLSLSSLCSSPGYRKADNKGLCPLDTTVTVFLPSCWCSPHWGTDIPKSGSHPGVATAAPPVSPCTGTSQLPSWREMWLCFPLGHQQPCKWAAGWILEPSPVFPSLVFPATTYRRARTVPVPEYASCFHPWDNSHKRLLKILAGVLGLPKCEDRWSWYQDK